VTVTVTVTGTGTGALRVSGTGWAAGQKTQVFYFTHSSLSCTHPMIYSPSLVSFKWLAGIGWTKAPKRVAIGASIHSDLLIGCSEDKYTVSV